MRIIIIKGKEVQRYEVADEEWALQCRAAQMSVEINNSLHPEDYWIWGEGGTPNDPTIVKNEL